MVRLSLDTPGPRLDWFPITRYNKYAGELLAAFELLLVRLCQWKDRFNTRPLPSLPLSLLLPSSLFPSLFSCLPLSFALSSPAFLSLSLSLLLPSSLFYSLFSCLPLSFALSSPAFLSLLLTFGRMRGMSCRSLHPLPLHLTPTTSCPAEYVQSFRRTGLRSLSLSLSFSLMLYLPPPPRIDHQTSHNRPSHLSRCCAGE